MHLRTSCWNLIEVSADAILFMLDWHPLSFFITSVAAKNSQENAGPQLPPEKQTAKSQEVAALIDESVDAIIGKASFSPLKTAEWNKKLMDTIIGRLTEKGETRKVIVHSSIAPVSADVGLNVSYIAYWNNNKDQVFTHRWESSSIVAIVHVFILVHKYS
ncbi:unnamed protein product [Caenorhabditis bovis]|uniref:Dynein light chain n=1 Tax=Caenorhabditis bovis TaxID=2654633 RepID=A0A8S1ETD5_9PELO|nr:unnamed protein product [Caenorhabditis bovis]